MAGVQAQLPPVTEPMMDKSGNMSLSWRRFFESMWLRSGGFSDFIDAALLASGFGDATIAELAASTDTLAETIQRLQANTADAALSEMTTRLDVLASDVGRAIGASADQTSISDIENAMNTRIEQIRSFVLASVSEDINQTINELRRDMINLSTQIAQLRGEDNQAAITSLTTDQVLEGITNLYFTVARARTSISASGSLAYDNLTGVMSYTTPTNSPTASAWQTPRTLALTGDGTSSMVVDGSANVSTGFTLATVNGTVGTFGSTSAVPVVTVNGKGLITNVTTAALGTAAVQNTGTSGANVPLLNGTNTWANAQTLTTAPVFTDQSGSRTALGLGTSATVNTGTSGATIPLLNGTNTWSSAQAINANLDVLGILTVTTSITSSGVLTMNGAAATNRQVRFSTSGTARWLVQANTTAESGSNAGSDFVIQPRDDAGGSLTIAMTITRSTSQTTFGRPPALPASTVAALPAAATYTNGIAIVTDATAPALGAIVAGGGAVRVAVTSDGTNWRVA